MHTATLARAVLASSKVSYQQGSQEPNV